MKYYLLILFIIIISLSVSGQNQFIGIKAAYFRTNVITNNSTSFNFQNGFSTGITYDYELEKNIYLGAELLYERRGYIEKIDFRDDNGNEIAHNYPLNNNFNYFSLPLKVSYSFGNNFYGLITAGICPSILQKAFVRYPKYLFNTNYTGDFLVSTANNYSKFDFSEFVEIDCGDHISSNLSITTSLRLQISSTPLKKPVYWAFMIDIISNTWVFPLT